jgi:hypothetical protein
MIHRRRRFAAQEDFRRARIRAWLERLLARLTGRPAELLCYDDVRQIVKIEDTRSSGLQDIPLDAIVGSTGRCKDFTRSFLPLVDEVEQRWVDVVLATTDLVGLPPIDAYKVGDVYFVEDGNHRVSVARQLGATHIQGHVTELQTREPISSDTRTDDLIVKIEYAQFLERTHLDELRPDADLRVSVPGQYRKLKEHISVHRYFMGIERGGPIPYEEAVTHWYDAVYLPVVRIIREQDLLHDFPDRTEADLYLWILEHRAELGKVLGQEVETEAAAEDLANRFSPKFRHALARVLEKIRSTIVPEGVASD